MTVKEMAGLIGPAVWKQAGFNVPVDVVDVKQSYGQVRLLIHPAGLPRNGQVWVARDSVITAVPADHPAYARGEWK